MNKPHIWFNKLTNRWCCECSETWAEAPSYALAYTLWLRELTLLHSAL